MSKLTRENVRAFLDRDWAAVRRVKDESLGRFVATHGPSSAAALAQALLDEVWPRINDPIRRAEDLAHHLEMRKKLGKTSKRR